MLYYTGLRSSDLLSIKAQDVDLANRVLKYYSPKRKIYRTITYHEDLNPIFERIINSNPSGKVLAYRSVENLQRAIKDYMDQLGFTNKRYTARTFRKTFITIARRKGMDESVVKELVGHSHTSTTDKFYNNIEHDQMSDELKKYLRVSNYHLTR